jgi:hypothetical protein
MLSVARQACQSHTYHVAYAFITSKQPFLGLSGLMVTAMPAFLRRSSSLVALVLNAPQLLHASITTLLSFHCCRCCCCCVRVCEGRERERERDREREREAHPREVRINAAARERQTTQFWREIALSHTKTHPHPHQLPSMAVVPPSAHTKLTQRNVCCARP